MNDTDGVDESDGAAEGVLAAAVGGTDAGDEAVCCEGREDVEAGATAEAACSVPVGMGRLSTPGMD